MIIEEYSTCSGSSLEMKFVEGKIDSICQEH
jgi:hypothetical protein